MKKGILIPYFETGMEVSKWAFFEDGKDGYDGLNILTEEHNIKVFDEANNIFFHGDIVKDIYSFYESYPKNPIKGNQIAGNLFVDWVQYNADIKKWLHMFSKEYRVEVTKTTKTKEDLVLLKEKIRNNYYSKANFKKEILLKPKLMFDIKNPMYYNKKGKDVLIQQLIDIDFKYQIFDNKIYVIYVMQNPENDGSKIDLSFIKKEHFSLITFDLNKEKSKLSKLHNYNKNNFKKYMSIVFKEDLTKEDEVFEIEFENQKEKLDKLKSKISEYLFEKIENSKKYILSSNGVNDTHIKLLCFNEKDSKWLLKLK